MGTEKGVMSFASDTCKEKKMRFCSGEMVLYRLKIISKTADIAEVNEKMSRVSRFLGVDTDGAVRPGNIYGLRG